MAYLNQRLKTAIERQDHGTIEQLLECGADPNAFLSGEDIAPIHLGPGISKSITYLLLRYGGDPNLRTSDGITPLHIAATWGNKSIVKLLLCNEANIYIRDDEGLTPLDMAKKYEHEKCEMILKRHAHLLESQSNIQKRKVRENPPLHSRIESHSQKRISTNGNFDASQDLFVDNDPEPHLSPIKPNKPRRSVLYRKEIQNQINHLCENKKDFHIDVTSPNHPCVNVTPKMKYLSSPKHIRAYTEPMAESTSTPKCQRRSLYTASIQNKIDKYSGNRENVGLDVTSPDHPELYFTPTAKSPLNYHQKMQYETPLNYHQKRQYETPLKSLPSMPFKSEDSSDIGSNSSESDLYVTVNEPSADYISKSPQNVLDIDKLKHSMTHKIVQLRHCLNKLDTQSVMTSQPLVSKRFEVQDVLYSRNKEPYSEDLTSEKKLHSKRMHKKVHGPNHDVDVKFKVELSPKMILDDGKSSRKLKHSQHQTSEINVGQRCENRKSKREPVIDIKIQPECESHNIKYKIKNKEPDPHQKSKLLHRNKESYKQKVVLKSPEIQKGQSSRARSKSAHENTCFQAQQDKKDCYNLAGRNLNGRCRQETYPGERISLHNQRESERHDHKESIHPSMLTQHGLRNQNKIANEHFKNAYIAKPSPNIVRSSQHVTSKNYGSKLSAQNQQLSHSNMMTSEKVTAQSRDQLNARQINLLERQIIPEKFSPVDRKVQIVPQFKNQKVKDLSKPQQKTVFMKERSECKYLNSNLVSENQIFPKRGCMVMNKDQKKDADQKASFKKVAHAPRYEKATKFPESRMQDFALHSQFPFSNIDPSTKHSSNRKRSSSSSTDTYYTCQSELDTEDFYSCENEFESCENPGNPYFITLKDRRKIPLRSSLEGVTEVQSSKESSYLREFEFNQDELVQALSEFDLTDPNTSALKDSYLNALSSLEERCDKSLVTTDQLRKHKQMVEETLCRTKSPLKYIPAQRNNSHYITTRADTEIRPKSPCAHVPLTITDVQYEEFETAIEETLLSKSLSKCKSPVSNQILSQSNSFPQYTSCQDNSEECSDSDTFFLLCIPSADNEFVSTSSQQPANISSSQTYDTVDHQNDGILHPRRGESDSLNPVESDVFHSFVNENTSGKISSDIKDTRNPFSINFSQVLSELKQKADLKAIQSQKKTCYRWQPPENVMNSSQTTDESFLNGKGRDSMLKRLKKKVGLELKDHPLVKSQKHAIENSFNSHYISAQGDGLHTSQVLPDKNQQKTAQPYNSAKYEFNESQLKNVTTRKCLDSTKQPQSKKTSILRQNAILVSDQISKNFSKCDQNQSHYISMQNKSQICEEPVVRKIAEKNLSFSRKNGNPDFDQSYYHSACKDESTDHSHYISLKKDSNDCLQSISSDGSLELEQSRYVSVYRDGSSVTEQSPGGEHSCYASIHREEELSCYASIHREEELSCYASIHREESSEEEPSRYVSIHREGSPEVELSRYVSIHREGSPEVELSRYVSIHREGSPEVELSRYASFCREGSTEEDPSQYVSIYREGSSEEDPSQYVSIHRRGSPEEDRSQYVSIHREGSSEEDRSQYVSIHREGSSEEDPSQYVSIHRRGSPEEDPSQYVSIHREGSPGEDPSQYVSIYRDGSSEEDPSQYVSIHRRGSPEEDPSQYVSIHRRGSPEEDPSQYVSIHREGSPEEDPSQYVSIYREGSPEEDPSQYVSIHREGSPEENQSCYTSICREGSPEAEQSHYVSAYREVPIDAEQSCYTVCREGSPDPSVKRLFSKCSRIPTLKDGKLWKQQKVIHSRLHNEPVTLQKRYIPPQNNHSLYLSAQDTTSGQSVYKDSFLEDKQNKTNFESVVDNNITSSSHWQYVSTKNSAHNRSVTWQNPISTFDEVDAALVDSTDESLSLSPRKEGHSPQAIPLTSTSASDEITSESISSDEFKRCLESKKLLSPEKRTTMWVNGIYKSNMQEYFDADMSSILPVLNSHSSSSDTGKNLKCGATAANMKSNHIEPSAPPQSEMTSDGSYSDRFRCIPTAPPDISNIAVAGTSGDKCKDLSNSDYVSLHPSLYPSLIEPGQNSVLKRPSESQLKDNNGNNLEAHALNASSVAYVSFGSEPEPPLANVHCSPENTHSFNQNKFGFTQKTNLCSINIIPQEVNANMQLPSDQNIPFLMRSNAVNKLHQVAKSISTQTPVLRIPPDPPNKFEPSLVRSIQSKELTKTKRTPKGWAKFKSLFTGKRIEGKIGSKAFISVDSNQSFLQSCHLSKLEEISPPLTDTSGTQTDPDIFYEPTFKRLEIIKSDEVSLSVNWSEHLSDYSEKYPASILPDLPENVEQAACSDCLETCSSSGATSGSMERLLSPYQEDSNEEDFDEVDCVQLDMHPIKEVSKDKDHPISTETKIYGETYRTKLFKMDKRRKSNDNEFLHTDPEMQVQFIERRISTESKCGEQSDESESTEIYDWKSFTKSVKDDDDDEAVAVAPMAETKSVYWRTCGEKPDDAIPNPKKLKKPLTGLGSLSNAELRQTLMDHGLSNPGPITQSTRQMYLKRLKNVSSGDTLVCTPTSPDYNAELSRAINGKIDWTEIIELEEKMIKKFDDPKNSRKWREGNEKSSFNYLLLDPRVTKNLPSRASKTDNELEAFRTFVKAIFYIGKGKRSRPYAHLYEAIKYSQGKTTKVNEKISHITAIWKSGSGVVSLHCFQNVIPVEAYSREACMVDAIGCYNLTNKKRGDFYGLTATWGLKLKRRMGVYLLHKALKIFLAEGERQIYPTDLH